MKKLKMSFKNYLCFNANKRQDTECEVPFFYNRYGSFLAFNIFLNLVHYCCSPVDTFFCNLELL